MKILPTFVKRWKLSLLLLGLVAFALFSVVSAHNKKAAPVVPPSPKIMFFALDSDVRQAVVVASDENTVTGMARAARFERKSAEAEWKQVGPAFEVTIGVRGFASSISTSGGERTPIGVARITGEFGREATSSKLPFHELVPGDCWINNKKSPAFNRWVTDPACTDPNLNLHSLDKLAFSTALLTDFNAAQAPQGGTAFFIHRLVSGSVGGSVAVNASDLTTLVKWLDPAKHPVVVTGTRQWLVGLDGSATNDSPDAGDGWRTVQRGSRGDTVRSVQEALLASGITVDVDGVFGAKTERAVKQYQQTNGLTVDGIVGEQTAAALGLAG